MSNGILIYAFNSNFDYVSAAKFAAKQAKKFLNLPVSIVTDAPTNCDIFDTEIILDDRSSSMRNYRSHDGTSIKVPWFNKNRTSAYDVSPYDKTLLIDADYFMFNDSLKIMFDTQSEFACFEDISNVSKMSTPPYRLSKITIPMQWATVVYFTKCHFANAVFDFMTLIKDNWEYYSLLYNFNGYSFRNDYALSIALQVLTGYSTHNYDRLPGKLHTLFSTVDVKRVSEEGEIIFGWDNELSKLINTNIHCMNKEALSRFYDSQN